MKLWLARAVVCLDEQATDSGVRDDTLESGFED
jgi:hypothetical protein